MTLRHVNVSARLHTNEPYESYFKRRIAHIVSTYCEQQANECRGTTLRLDKVQPSSHSHHPSLHSHDEPLLTQENVIVLSVHMNATANTTTIGFVVTKANNVGSLNELMVVDAFKVKSILSAQLAPLSRVLGGIRIERVEVVPMRRTPDVQQTDNTKLLIVLAITGLFLLVTYTIATIKVCRECHERKRTKKNEATPAGNHNLPDYGSCGPAGSKRTDDDVKRRRSNKDGSEPQAKVIGVQENRSEPPQHNVIDERRFHLLFQCDPSQLPDEQLSFPRTPSIQEIQPIDVQPQPQFQNPSIPEQSSNQQLQTAAPEQPKQNPVAPSLAVIEPASSDPSAELYLQTERNDAIREEDELPERPVSRRGSYSRSDMLDKTISPPPPLASELMAESQVIRSRTAHELGHWSSESDEEGQSEGYHKLSEPEDDEHEPEMKKRLSTEDSEKETNENFENFEENTNVYERLDESNPSSPSPPVRDTPSPSPFMV
ncbi:hypothetical protein Tcan_10727 [Toxocara canis]|nr:hypothetical protein Tcan_10727 [Toxocara canis]